MRKTILTVCSSLLLAASAVAQLPSPIIHVDFDDMTSGTEVRSFDNHGSYKGTFSLTDPPTSTPVNVRMVAGEKALVFGQYNPTSNANEAFGIPYTSNINVPAEMVGNHAWTVRVRVYQKQRLDPQGTIFTWGGQPFFQNGQNANINFGTNNGAGRTGPNDTFNNGAYEHWNNDGSFTDVPTTSTWHDLVLTYDGSHEIMYVDGVVDSDTDRSATPLNINGGVADATTFILGQGRIGWNPYTGAVSKIQAFGDALTQAQVTQLIANNMAGLPTALVNVNIDALTSGSLATTVANAGSLGGNFTASYTPIQVPYVTERNGVKGIKFNTTTAYRGDNPVPLAVKGHASFTVFFRVYNPSIPAPSNEEPVLQWAARGGPDGTYACAELGTNATWGAIAQWGSADVSYTNYPTTDAWHDIAIVYNAGANHEIVYVDNVVDKEVDRTLNIGGDDYLTVADDFYVGTNSANPPNRASLVMNSLELYPYALTAAQVAQLPGGPIVNAAHDWTLY